MKYTTENIKGGGGKLYLNLIYFDHIFFSCIYLNIHGLFLNKIKTFLNFIL